MAVANLHDSLGQDRLTLRRAKPFTAQDVGNLKVRVAFSPQLPGALDHRIVARHVTLAPDRRDHDALREMATGPDDLDFHPVRGRPLDHHACNQAAQQRLALRVTKLRAQPQIGEALAQVQQLMAEFGRQRRLVGLMGEALRRFLSLTKSPESIIPLAFEFGRRKTVRWIDVFVAAPGQGGGKAGVTHLLLMVGFQSLALPLVLSQHLVSALELRGRHGVEKGLHHEGFD